MSASTPRPPRLKPFLLLPLVAIVMSLAHCDCSTMESLFVTEEDEREIGTEFDGQLQLKPDSFPLFKADTPEKEAFRKYVNDIFDEVLDAVPVSERPSYHDRFKITIIDKNVENAFAVPGGYVYLYTGIIPEMQSESELAGVLGHEIAHVTRHHYRDALVKMVGLQVLLDAVVGDAGQLTQLIAGIFAQMTALSTSRDNEYEADQAGTNYIGAAQRHPMGIAEFFDRMEGTSLEWLSTHPSPDNRVGNISSQIRNDPKLSALAGDGSLRYTSRFLEKTAFLRR